MTEANLVRRGIALPTVGNPAAANHILKGYEVVTADGELLVGTLSGTNSIVSGSTYPTVQVTSHVIHQGYAKFTGFSDNTREFANSYGFVPRISGSTLITYFAQISGFSQGTSARRGPHGEFQINPYSKYCVATHVPSSDRDIMIFRVQDAQFFNTYMTATVICDWKAEDGSDYATITMNFRQSYSLWQTISIPGSL